MYSENFGLHEGNCCTRAGDLGSGTRSSGLWWTVKSRVAEEPGPPVVVEVVFVLKGLHGNWGGVSSAAVDLAASFNFRPPCCQIPVR